MTLEDYRNIAVISGVIVALIVYITNSYFQYKQRISENAMRCMDLHDKLFENKFLKCNLTAIENGMFERSESNEKDFVKLLADIEKLALLTRTGVVSKTIAVYMFEWFGEHIPKILTQEERDNVYWEVTVEYLEELKNESDDFRKKTKTQRNKYFRKNHFFH